MVIFHSYANVYPRVYVIEGETVDFFCLHCAVAVGPDSFVADREGS